MIPSHSIKLNPGIIDYGKRYFSVNADSFEKAHMFKLFKIVFVVAVVANDRHFIHMSRSLSF